ncbi:MAG: ribosomal protein L13e [Candidatus Bathyarchaeota archaeon]|nr:ribosomal protein L13e [Candidatus Bathyarchaeota archaeon]MDH5495531.1 ribosomal protein L13e [Candidatus Bathyarchaeota archaeon]
MALRNRLIVRKKSGEKRKGRGFSREELKKAGISLKQALHVGLPVDVRRRTVHGENVKLIKRQLKKSNPKAKKKTS